EVTGLLPSQEWKMRRYKQKWYAGDTISVGIGQGYNLTTPLQLAFATAILGSKGTAFRPHLVKQVHNNKNNVVREIVTQPLYTLDLNPDNLAHVRNALIAVTRPGGTAALAGAGAAYDFAGKTGTSQVVGMKQGEKYVESKVQERHRDHALFVAYAPAENPKIALSVLVENGGHGGATAAPIARLVMDYFLLGKLPEEAAAKTVNQGDGEEGAHD
ncbi:MAG: penicillin-binding transpeptidase domain-containing protein, partial [Nitrosospira sp.]